MRLKLGLAALAVAMFATVPVAEAIEGPRAVRHIKRLVATDCRSYQDFSCEGWRVWGCYKLSRRKVRCRSYQEYRHNGNWRICYFRTSAVENRARTYVRLHFGRVRCYSESGAPIR